MKSVYGSIPYALKICVTDEALQAVKGLEGNYVKMFRCLDDKFDNARKIVDLVIRDLKSLKRVSDGDSKGFIKMDDQVEQCWLDLKRVNLSSELNTAHVVCHIEKVLPPGQKREYVIKAEEVSNTADLFPNLLELLQKEKRVLEYMNSSVRTSSVDKAMMYNVNLACDSDAESDLVNLVKK